jgi:hypothetical protein
MYKAASLIDPAVVLPKYMLMKFYLHRNNKGMVITTANEILSTDTKIQNSTSTMIKDSTRIILDSIK